MSTSLPLTISRSTSTSTVVPTGLQETAQAVPLQEMSASFPLPQPRANPSTSNQPPVSPTATSPLSSSKLTRFVHLFNPPASTSSPGSSTEALAEGTRALGSPGVTYSSLGMRRGSRSSGEQTYSTRTRSGTLDSSGGIGESPHSHGRSSWTVSTPASSASALFAPSMHWPSTELQSRARSSSLSRTNSNTSSSTSSSADYLNTPAQSAGQVYEPKIVREGERSPWSTGSNEGRRGKREPAIVDPRFQFPVKRGNVGKGTGAAVGLGLGMTSAPERTAASAQAGSYVASLGLAPLVDEQGNTLPLYPSTSPRLATSPSLSSGSPSSIPLPLPPSASRPTSPNKTRLLSAFQPSLRPSSSSTVTATPRRTSSGRSSPKRKGKKHKHRVGSSSVGLLGQPLRHRRRSSASGSGSSTDRPKSSAMRPSPSAPNLLIHSPSSPPRPSASATLPRTRPLATLSRPAITRSSSFSHPSTTSSPRLSNIHAHAPISTCEAYIFPRPRLARPPSSPPLPSSKGLQEEWKRRQRAADPKGEAKAIAQQQEEDDLSLRRVLRENEESRRERANWSDSGLHSLGFGMGRKLSLSSRGRRARSASRSRGGPCRPGLPDSEWEAESDRQLEEVRLRRRKMVEKEERKRVRKEREREMKRRAQEEGSDTEVEGVSEARVASRDEGGYLDPYYSPPTVHSFEPFTTGAGQFKGLVRRLSESRSKSRERRGSEAGLGGESDGAGAVSDGGKRRRKPSWSTSARRRGGSLAPLPPLPGLADSLSLGDFHSHQPHSSTSTARDLNFSSTHGLRYVGNRPIRHLRTSPSLDSLSPRASAHTRQQYQGPTATQFQYGEALTDLNGSTTSHRSSGVARAATLTKQNAAVSLPPHLHHLLRSPNAPSTSQEEKEGDTSFIPSRAPPPVPASVASLRTAATQGSPRSKDSHGTGETERDKMSENSATELYVVAERKLAGGADREGAEGKAEKENLSTSQQPTLPLQPSTAAPLAWRNRQRSPSLDSIPHFSGHPYSQPIYTRSPAAPAPAPAPSSSFLPFPTQPNPPYARRRCPSPPKPTEQLHSGSLPPPQRLRRVRPSLESSLNLSLASFSSNDNLPVSGAPRAPLDEDLTTSLGPGGGARAPMGVMDTPTLGSGRSRAGPGSGEYFSLPVDSPSNVLGSLALATTEEDPFAARSQRQNQSVDTPRSAGSGRSYEGHVYGAGAGAGVQAAAQPPLDSPESARSSGGESGMLNVDEGEWSFENLFFRPPPTNADRSVLPQPTPIEMHRVSSSSRLITTPTSSDDGRHTLLISPSSTYDRDLVAEPGRQQRLSIGESMEGQRRSWTASEASVYSAGEDPTFGRRVGGDLRLSLDDVFRYSQGTARAFDGHAAEEEDDDRPSTRASETWATAEDGGDDEDEDGEDGQRRPRSPPTQMDDLSTRAVRPSPSPALGDWTATSFAREYLGSTDSQPPSRTHSAPADQLSFIDFTTARDSRQTLTSPTPTRRSDRSSRSERGSFLELGDGDSPPRPARDQREVESRSSFFDEWSPPASPTEPAPLSFPVILATSSSDQGHPEATPSPPQLPHSPFSVDEGRFSDELVQARAQGRESYLSVDSPRSALFARNSSGTLSSSRAGEIGTGTGGSSPMAASFHSHFSKLDDFPSPPPPGNAEHLHPPPHRSSLHPLDRTRDSSQSLRRPRSMPQVPPSPPRAGEVGATKRRSSSFLDLYDEASRPLSTATSSSSYSRPPSQSERMSSASLRPWSTSQASFATFFSGGGSKRDSGR